MQRSDGRTHGTKSTRLASGPLATGGSSLAWQAAKPTRTLHAWRTRRAYSRDDSIDSVRVFGVLFFHIPLNVQHLGRSVLA